MRLEDVISTDQSDTDSTTSEETVVGAKILVSCEVNTYEQPRAIEKVDQDDQTRQEIIPTDDWIEEIQEPIYQNVPL